jgi:hypothetical protein
MVMEITVTILYNSSLLIVKSFDLSSLIIYNANSLNNYIQLINQTEHKR